MCGLTGYWDFKAELSRGDSQRIARAMSLEIEHRGPDSQGIWVDEAVGLAFAHQRLAIVDLSTTGHQPMISKSGRSVIIYNGEIFNTDDLRNELKLETRGQSDTEVILEACELLGVEAACKRLIGMFAFVLWDRERQELSLVRDRLGIKPLYWGLHNGVLLFGSQLRSFFKHPAWKPELNLEAQKSYFQTNYIPAPMTVYQGMQKLMPGTILTIERSKNQREVRFWDLKNVSRVKIEDPIEQLHVLLRDVVKRRMIADVPLGAFLSGGIDSSTIVALMQAQSNKPIRTFSIGSHQANYDESKRAEKIARHLGTEHTTWVMNDREAQTVIPKMPEYYDEPFGDASQIPTYWVSQLARRSVTVTLSGDGGDELFAGYNRYWVGYKYWPVAKKIPIGVRNFLAFGLKQFPVGRQGERLYKFGDWLSARDESEFYERSSGRSGVQIDPDNFVSAMQQVDLKTYLPDDILVKVDRASMAVGLEARVPFLDHRLVEFAMNLSLSHKLRNGQTKWILRRVLEKYVPEKLTNSKKMGFGVPIDTWLRGPLREWAETLLKDHALETNGLDVKTIRQKWQEHLQRKANWQYPIWGVLMYQAWHERWVK